VLAHPSEHRFTLSGHATRAAQAVEHELAKPDAFNATEALWMRPVHGPVAHWL
jgi:hypothetical protein